MRNLMKYYEIAVEKCLEQDIPIVEPKEVKINKRYTMRWGSCRGRYINGKFFPTKIDINPVLLDERNSERGLIETLIHELIHTVPGCQNHSYKWKAYADKVNRAYGYHIQTKNSDKDKGISEECTTERMTAIKAKYKYELTCQKCGAKNVWSRPSKAWTHPEGFRCSLCKGMLKRTGEMDLLKAVWN